MADTRAGKAYPTAAENVAAQHGLYDLDHSDWSLGATIDSSWAYEPRLAQALDALLEGDAPISALQWATDIVPFVSGLFARDPDFQRDFHKRAPHVEHVVPAEQQHDNAMAARILDFQHLLAPIMAMRWHVVHFPSESELVTSDTGLSAASTPAGEGYIIPIAPHAALVLVQSARNRIAQWSDSEWVADINHLFLDEREAANVPAAVARFAKFAVFGPTHASVVQLLREIGVAPRFGRGLLGAGEEIDFGCHLYDFFRALSVMNREPQDGERTPIEIDWDLIEKVWRAPIAVEVLFPERTLGGVIVSPSDIAIDLSFGFEVRRLRRSVGDFRQGALGLMPASELRKTTVPLTPRRPTRVLGRDGRERLVELRSRPAFT